MKKIGKVFLGLGITIVLIAGLGYGYIADKPVLKPFRGMTANKVFTTPFVDSSNIEKPKFKAMSISKYVYSSYNILESTEACRIEVTEEEHTYNVEFKKYNSIYSSEYQSTKFTLDGGFYFTPQGEERQALSREDYDTKLKAMYATYLPMDENYNLVYKDEMLESGKFLSYFNMISLELDTPELSMDIEYDMKEKAIEYFSITNYNLVEGNRAGRISINYNLYY